MMRNKRSHLDRTRQMIVFAMLGSIMFVSKVVMEFLPNLHLVGVLTMVYTLVYRSRALIPIYVFVLLNGLYAGFQIWWIPYLYIWTVLWGITMLLPRNMPKKIAIPVYMTLCALHGLSFGVLYAPFQALAFGFSFEQTVAWVLAGLPFDLIHTVGNLALGTLILPLSELLRKMETKFSPSTRNGER